MKYIDKLFTYRIEMTKNYQINAQGLHPINPFYPIISYSCLWHFSLVLYYTLGR